MNIWTSWNIKKVDKIVSNKERGKKITNLCQTNYDPGPLSLTWFNFNPIMDT